MSNGSSLSNPFARICTRRIGINLVLALASTLAALALGEVGLRIYQRIKYGLPLSASGLSQASLRGRMAGIQLPNLLDAKLGWASTPNYRFQGLATNRDGSTYPLTVTKNSEGFRKFGTVNTDKPKLLVIGDSFTEALDVSDDKTYYFLIGKALGIEVFAIGSGGYSTLQEYMVLDQFLDQIQPDLILWQFCYNDFMDNCYALDLKWTSGSQSLRRPYWNNGGVEYHLPKSFPWLREIANTDSRLFYLVFTRLDKLLAPSLGSDRLINEIVSQGDSHRGFQQAREITRQLLQKVSERVGTIPVVVFESCTTASPFYPAVQRIAIENGMHFVDELPGVLDREKAKGSVVNSPDDVHWNDAGHRIVAVVLEDYLRRYLPVRKPGAA
jgi:hypothetical protein